MAATLISVKNRKGISRLRQWREAEGLTLQEVSGLTGVSIPMLCLVEQGKRRLSPRAKVLVARGVGVAIRDLFEPEELPDERELVAR